MRPCRRSEADELETGPNARDGWEAAVPQPSLGGRFAEIGCSRDPVSASEADMQSAE